MITLNCSQCRSKIQVDDAFAGGVCRCQHCGAINHVSGGAKPKPASKSSGGGRSPSDTSLGQLADVASLAGMTSDQPERLRAPGPVQAPGATATAIAPSPRPRRLTIAVVAVIALAVLAVLAWLVMADRPSDLPPAPAAAAAAD